jgi:hypothetical protein
MGSQRDVPHLVDQTICSRSQSERFILVAQVFSARDHAEALCTRSAMSRGSVTV